MKKLHCKELETLRSSLNLLETSLERYEEDPQFYDDLYNCVYGSLSLCVTNVLCEIDKVYNNIRYEKEES